MCVRGPLGEPYDTLNIIMKHDYRYIYITTSPQMMEKCREYFKKEILRKELEQNPNKRTIIWIVDPDGNMGKTWFTKYMTLHQPKDVIRFTNAKSNDVKYAYGGQRIVFFDYSRSQEGHINYEV